MEYWVNYHIRKLTVSLDFPCSIQRQNLISIFKGEVENASTNQRTQQPTFWLTTLVEGVEYSFPASLIKIHAAVVEEKSKMCLPIRGQGCHFCLLSIWNVMRKLRLRLTCLWRSFKGSIVLPSKRSFRTFIWLCLCVEGRDYGQLWE